MKMESRPRHIKTDSDSRLFHELKRLVKERLELLPKSRIVHLKIKLLVYPLVYFACYVLALYQADRLWLFFLSYSFMGIMAVIMFCELIHELAHNNIFKKSLHNRLAFKLFDLIGANSYIWQKRHINLHHQYPNLNGWDADIEQRGPIAIFPNENKQKITRYQHRYMFLLYPLFMLNWLFIRDFRDYFSANRIIRKVIEIPRIEYFKLFLFKFLYVLMIIGIPVAFAGFSMLEAIAGVLFLTISGSVLAMFVVLTPHINTGNEFPQPDAEGKIAVTWFRHQLITTNDIDNSNWLTRNFMGNFNFHVVHHLFPRVSSVYAPEVTDVLRSFTKKHDLPYKSYPISHALRKHYDLIRRCALPLQQMQE